jgi:hypothetical protein
MRSHAGFFKTKRAAMPGDIADPKTACRQGGHFVGPIVLRGTS